MHRQVASSYQDRRQTAQEVPESAFRVEYLLGMPIGESDQITQTEASVGFALPPLLSQLYTRIANGGFGPGGGIRGCIGGYGTPMSMGDDAGTLLGYYEWKRATSRLVDFSELSDQWELGASGALELPYNVWPIHLLHIADMECGMQACVDAVSQHMYWTGLSHRRGMFILEKTNTLEEWLLSWMRGGDRYE